MSKRLDIHRQRIPRILLFLDAVGAVLVAIGVLDLLQAGPPLVPAALRFPGAGIVLIVAGITVMLALPAWLIRRHRGARP